MSDDIDSEPPATATADSFAQFLEKTPPGEFRLLPADAFGTGEYEWTTFKWPPVQLFCNHESCNGFRFADPSVTTEIEFMAPAKRKDLICEYSCRNCHQLLKHFTVLLVSPKDDEPGKATKAGELPVFGPHLPREVISLLGTDADYFAKGHRAESAGLGIAAFAYYRRVVESQRTHLFDEIIAVAERVNAEKAVIDRLRSLREHWRFQRSIDEIKDCIPQALLIEGHNPLELLHPVLSDSIHDRSDEEALEIATEIRLILIDLADRIKRATSKSVELQEAVEKLAKRKAQRGQRAGPGA